MSDSIETLLRDLIAWIAIEDRAYSDVMAAWRTSCPRMPVWEEANARGLLLRTRRADGTAVVQVTDAGRAFLEQPAS
jgi:hypothetical protein